MAKDFQRAKTLRSGFSTGTAATAAARAALREILGIQVPEEERVRLPQGGVLAVRIERHGRAGSWGEARVIKDAGDDPDVTHGAEIGARVRLIPGNHNRLEIRAGEGVGLVTKPGLPVSVGEPAVNPVPRRMLREGLAGVWQESGVRPRSLEVEIFVPRGEELARRTLNPRLGIVGGISILGTTGLVQPFSHQAYRATIASALKVARAAGLGQVVLTTGGKSEEYLRNLLPVLPPEAFVQMGDYVSFALKVASRLGFRTITVGLFFGKAVKIAQGFGCTHVSRGLADLGALAELLGRLTPDLDLRAAVARARSAREVFALLPSGVKEALAAEVGRLVLGALRRHAGPKPGIAALLLDFTGQPLFWGRAGGWGL